MAHIKVPHLYHHRNRHINHYTHADSYHYVINASETKYAIMGIGVPAGASLGDYYHKINATVYQVMNISEVLLKLHTPA